MKLWAVIEIGCLECGYSLWDEDGAPDPVMLFASEDAARAELLERLKNLPTHSVQRDDGFRGSDWNVRLVEVEVS